LKHPLKGKHGMTWQSDYIEANGLRHHYIRTGGDKPALVLAHGFSDNGLCWSALAEALEDSYDVIMPDARGHGLSDSPETGYNPVLQADDLAGIITGLRLDRPIVMGHSMGAMTMLTLAGRHPHLPRAVILEDPPPWWLAPSGTDFYSEEWRTQTMGWLGPLRAMTRQDRMAHGRKQDPQWPEAEFGPWADSKAEFNLNFLNPQPPLEIDWATILMGVSAPLLLIISEDERGAILSPTTAATLKIGVPHAQIVQILNAGHCIRRDQPEAYLTAMKEFTGGLGK
jgi:N-formylmaleamate deformylase